MQDLNDKVTGGTLTAAEWNEVPSEIQNVIEGLGITLSGADLNQLGKAIAGYVANGTFYTDSGAADAYVLSVIGSKQAPTAYTDGLKISFVVGNTNTGASTVNVASLGVKDLKKESGSTALDADDLVGGSTYTGVFDLAADAFDVVLAGPQLTVFTASGSYTKPAGLKAVKVSAVGGGGGGAEGPSAQRGGGGGGAGTAIAHIPASVLAASETVTIGAGGAGGVTVGVSGTAGGTTSLGTLLTAAGGGGGASSAGGVAAGGAGTELDYIKSGGHGSDGTSGTGGSGDGGNSAFGGGGRSGSGGGIAGTIYGGGGGSGTGGVGSGAAGAQGIVIIEEFF